MSLRLLVELDQRVLVPPTDFSQFPLSVGRRATGGLQIKDPRVSGLHGRFQQESGQIFYEDLGSRNGSLLLRGSEKYPALPGRPLGLEGGDELLLGDQLQPLRIRVLMVGEREHHEDSGAETILSRHQVALSTAAEEGALLKLFYTLSCEERSEALLRAALAAILERSPQGAGVGFFEIDQTHIPHAQPGLWLSGEQRCALRPSRTLSREAIERREALLYLSNAERDLKSMAGLSATLIAPLLLGDRCLGLISVQCQSLTPDQHLLRFVGALALYLAARLAAIRKSEALAADRAALDEENQRLHRQLRAGQVILGSSPALQRLLELLDRVARTNATVLLQGETGTGKELAARYLHAHSSRASGPFRAINCGALSESLLQSELFGHQRGAFSGADRDRKGLFEAASGGTLLLDELGEISPATQVALLRVLQEGEVRPLGAQRARTIDVRIIAATHKDLSAEIEAGRFREDLYYRLSVFPVSLPPLRDRREDIIELAEYFRARSSARHDVWVSGFSEAALAQLQGYLWPGNIRQLEHEVERAVILAAGQPEITPEHLSRALTRTLGAPSEAEPYAGGLVNPQGLGDAASPSLERVFDSSAPLKEVMGGLEERVIRERLGRFGENRTRTAESLGISRQALQAKLARWRRERDEASEISSP